jgi:hypothetical protein
MKYVSVELIIDRSIVRLTFETVPEGYEGFQRVTIQADDLFTLLVHVDEQHDSDTTMLNQEPID